MELGPGWYQGYRRVQDSVGIQVPEEESHQGTAFSEPGITKEQGCSELSTGEACSVMTEDQTQRLVRQLVVVDKADGDREAFLDGTKSNFMAQVSLEEWQGHQRSDTDLGPVIQWLQSDATSKQADLILHSRTTKHLWLCRKQLQMKQGVLFYEWDHGVQKSLLLVIPRSLKEVVIGLFHDTKVGGHLGREKTKRKYDNELTGMDDNRCGYVCRYLSAMQSEQEVTEFESSIAELSGRLPWGSSPSGYTGALPGKLYWA